MVKVIVIVALVVVFALILRWEIQLRKKRKLVHTTSDTSGGVTPEHGNSSGTDVVTEEVASKDK